MGRPTDEKKERTVKLRISEEMYLAIGEGNKSEIIREMIREGIKKHGEIQKGESVPHNLGKQYSSGIEGNNGSNNDTLGKPSKIEESGSNVPQYRQDLMDKAVERDIKKMCEVSGISTHDFFRGVDELWNKGQLEIEGFKVRAIGEYNIKRLVELSYIMGQKPQVVIDKLTGSLERSVQ